MGVFFFLFLFRFRNEMPFQRFVEVGRVALCADGACSGKIAAIVDVIDQNRALIDGPEVPRQAYRIKDLHLIKFKLKFGHSAKSKIVHQAWSEEEVSKKFAESSWGQRLHKASVKANLTDFDKFKLNKLKTQRRRIVSQKMNQLAKKK